MDDRTPGYDEPDRDELTRPLSLSEWDYLVYVRAERNRRTIRRTGVMEALRAFLRPKGGAWRHGRRWKVWGQVGDWFAADMGVGGFWLYCGRLSISANRHAVRREHYSTDRGDDHYAYLSVEWRRKGA